MHKRKELDLGGCNHPRSTKYIMNKNLLLGIDEITLVILPVYKMDISVWEEYAEAIILNFIQLSEIEIILNSTLEISDTKKLSGYNINYNLGIQDYYFCIAYNSGNPEMGVCIKFSAKAWAIYQSKYNSFYNKRFLLPDFLKKLNDNMVDQVRLSRIDLTADFINYGLDLNVLNERMNLNEILVQDDSYKSRIKNFESYSKNDSVETIYIGSRKKNSNGFLRIYNKLIEQIRNNGFRLKEALQYDEWIRFEAVFKGKYAHSISETLIKEPMNDIEFTQYISKIITQKYRFFDIQTDDYTFFTKELLVLSDKCTYDRLRIESPRDNALSQNINHILHGSGLFPTFYKIQKLYGNEAVENFISFLRLYYHQELWLSTTMSKELNIWLKKHADLKEIPFKYNCD